MSLGWELICVVYITVLCVQAILVLYEEEEEDEEENDEQLDITQLWIHF